MRVDALSEDASQQCTLAATSLLLVAVRLGWCFATRHPLDEVDEFIQGEPTSECDYVS